MGAIVPFNDSLGFILFGCLAPYLLFQRNVQNSNISIIIKSVPAIRQKELRRQ